MYVDFQIFICTNIKEKPNAKFCDGSDLVKACKNYLKLKMNNNTISREIFERIRINKSGCLGKCALGKASVSYVKKNNTFHQQLMTQVNEQGLKDHIDQAIKILEND